MIITVPEHKKIYYSDIPDTLYKPINESFFDDPDDYIDDPYSSLRTDIIKNSEEQLVPRVEKILFQLNIPDYDINCTGNGIYVNIPDHLFLPNRGLNKYDWTLFRFGEILGDVNFSNNGLTNWNAFPTLIHGNCIANFNYIHNFYGAPTIEGRINMLKQKIKTQYPLTTENYIKYKNHELSENAVYSLMYNDFGELTSINEDKGVCVIQFDNSRKICKLDEVEYLGNIENLFK